MTTTLNPDIIGTIAQKLCNQILAFQLAIESRSEGQQYPTSQEANQQHKMISCLLRLVKQPVKPRKEQGSTSEDQTALQSWAKAVKAIMEDKAPDVLHPGSAAPVRRQVSNVITPRDFEQYGHQLGKKSFAHLSDKATIKFNGRYVNAKWLEYNLSQYLLPLEDRHFIEDAREVIELLRHNKNEGQIRSGSHNKVAA